MSKKNNQNMPPTSSRLHICKICEASIPKGARVCIICGGNKSNNQTVPHLLVGSPETLQKQRRFPQLVAFFLMIAMFASCFAVGGFAYINHNRLKAIFNTNESVLYGQGENNLMLQLAHREEPYLIDTQFMLDPALPLVAADSYDQRYIAYLSYLNLPNQNAGLLFLLDLTLLEKTKQDAPEKIKVSEDLVIDFHFSKTQDQLIYLTDANDLFLVDYSENSRIFPSKGLQVTKLDEDVKGIVALSDSAALYYKGESVSFKTLDENEKKLDNELQSDVVFSGVSLYRCTSNGKPKLVDQEVTQVLDYDSTLDDVFYLKQNESTVAPVFSLYEYRRNSCRLIATGVSYIVSANAEDGSLLYLKANPPRLSYDHLFSDSLLESDNAIENPSRMHRPIFPTEEEESLMDEAEKEYKERKTRDQLREYLHTSLNRYQQESDLSYTLLHRTKWEEKNTTVASSIPHLQHVNDLVYVSDDGAYVLFVTSDFSQIHTLDLGALSTSEIEHLLETPFLLPTYLSGRLPETLVAYHLKEPRSTTVYTDQGERTIRHYQMSNKEQEVYFISYPTSESQAGTLYSTRITPQGIDKLVFIDEMVSSVVGSPSNKPDIVYYQTVNKENPPQYALVLAIAGEKREIANNTASHEYFYLEDDGSLNYFYDYSTYRKQGVLIEYAEGELLVGKQVSAYAYFSKGRLLVLQSLQEGQRLLTYQQGESKEVDTQVHQVFVFGSTVLRP